jgi:hypothetical protein
MSTKDFFRVLFKLFGLYILLSVFVSIPEVVTFYRMVNTQDAFVWTDYTSMLFIPTILFSIFCLLVFYPDIIIKNLKLDRGMDTDHIAFEKIDQHTIVRLGLIIVGGLLVLKSISPTISTGYYLLKASVPGALERDDFTGFDPFDYRISLGTHILNLIVGYLAITNSDRLSNFLLPKKKLETENIDG